MMSVSPAIIRRKRGLVCGTGKYLRAPVTAAFDDKTSFSVVMFYENSGTSSPGHGDGIPFSMWDGDAVDSGFFILYYSGQVYFYTGQGTNDGGSNVTESNTTNYQWGGSAISTQKASPTNVLAMTYDASSNTKSVWNINSALMTKNTGTYSTSNWGTVYDSGAITDIRIGNHWDGSGDSTYQCDEDWKIGSCSLWFSALSEANIFSLCNLSGTINDDDTDIGMVYDVGYSAAGVTQPNHIWLNPYGGDFSNFETTDTGSTGGVAMSAEGSPTISYSPQ